MNKEARPFEEYKEMIQDMSKDNMIKGLYDLSANIIEKDKEIERLKNGYCELKVKCNNGECDCTNEEYDEMVEGNIKLSLEVDRLNNIINELEEDLERNYIRWKKYAKTHKEDAWRMIICKYYLDKLKELKEGE